MSLYTKARRHINMNRVKELREEEIKEQKIAEVKEQQEKILAELKRIEIKEDPKYSNWRRDLENLNENMTTSGLGMINYQAGGDTNLETALGSVSLNANNVDSGENAQVTSSVFDTTKYDTIKFTVTQLTSGTQALRLFGNYGSDPNIFYIMKNDLKANSVVSLSSFGAQKSNFRFQVRSFNDDPGNMATYRVSASFQRRTPINVFVSLDDPEANSFIRGGLGGDKERRAKLKDMLDAGNELMIRMGLEPSKTSPGDIEIAGGKALYGPVDNRLKPDGSRGFNSPGELNKGNSGKWYEWDGNKWNPVPSLDLAMNQGPSTPVKTDTDGRLVPNPGGGRVKPGSIRLKGKAKRA